MHQFRIRASVAVLLLAPFFLLGCNGDNNPVDNSDNGPNESGLRALISADPMSVPAGDDHSTIVTISGADSVDPEGADLTYQWTVQLGTFVNGTDADDETIQVTFPGITPYDVTLTVTDPDGNTDTASAVIGLEGDGGVYGTGG